MIDGADGGRLNASPRPDPLRPGSIEAQAIAAEIRCEILRLRAAYSAANKRRYLDPALASGRPVRRPKATAPAASPGKRSK